MTELIFQKGLILIKPSLSKECDICHYLYFRNIDFKYEKNLCNGCHDLMQKAMSFNNVTIVYVNRNAYRIHFWYMSKDDAINIMNGSNLVYKRGIFIIFFFILYIKLSENIDLTYYQKQKCDTKQSKI